MAAKHLSYRYALRWLCFNDDCYWLGRKEPTLSVTASLVADMFGKSDEKLTEDLRAMLRKIYPDHEALQDAITA